jgi:acetyl-CoA carboxylase biotin carboxyl carrier protein
MLTFEQIKELVALVGSHRLQGLEIERAGMRVKITGEAPPVVRELVAPAAAPLVAAAPAASAARAAAPSADETASSLPLSPPLHVVASPIVGTFYAAPSPDSPSYVRVGDRISKGQVLCIVEAMKLMNEIESDADGVVSEIYPKNAQPVEYGEPLFGIRAD